MYTIYQTFNALYVLNSVAYILKRYCHTEKVPFSYNSFNPLSTRKTQWIRKNTFKMIFIMKKKKTENSVNMQLFYKSRICKSITFAEFSVWVQCNFNFIYLESNLEIPDSEINFHA